MRRRAKSSCGRCSTGRDRQPSPGRATYLPSEKGRNLSLEIDGRQSRTVRRSASSGRDELKQSRKGAHCFVIPYANGSETVTSPTTYKDDYRSPMGFSPFPSSRSNINFRSSPSPSSNSSSSSSPFSFRPTMSRSTTSNLRATPTQRQPPSLPPAPPPPSHRPRGAMTRSATVDNNFGSTKTTYMDHYTWRNGY